MKRRTPKDCVIIIAKSQKFRIIQTTVKTSRQCIYEMDYFIYKQEHLCLLNVVSTGSFLIRQKYRTSPLCHSKCSLDQPLARRTKQMFLGVPEIKLPEPSDRRSRKLQSIVIDNKSLLHPRMLRNVQHYVSIFF